MHDKVYETKDEVQQMKMVQKCVEQVMQVEQIEVQTKWRNIELLLYWISSTMEYKEKIEWYLERKEKCLRRMCVEDAAKVDIF